MENKILVYLEQRSGVIKKSSFETIKAGKEFAAKYNAELEAVVIGSNIEELDRIGAYGVAKVTHLKNENLDLYSASAYTDLIADYAKEINAGILIFSDTAMGKDLAPRAAVKLEAGIAMDCTNFEFEGDDIVATRPVYAGKALLNVKIKSSVKVFTIRPNIFIPDQPNGTTAEINTREVAEPNLSSRVIELKKVEGKLDVAEADIIVSGGRGLKAPENFSMVEELAEQLGAAVGASRVVVDAGWRPHNEQVGQTGKTVNPTLYIAVGISGAIQHLAGMRSSKYIVAINKDKNAPIFEVADYGITGDALEIVPALIDELKKN